MYTKETFNWEELCNGSVMEWSSLESDPEEINLDMIGFLECLHIQAEKRGKAVYTSWDNTAKTLAFQVVEKNLTA